MTKKKNEDLHGHHPEARWRVGYLVKPLMEIRYWEGQAPSYLAAQLFATKSITEEGWKNLTHIKTERID